MYQLRRYPRIDWNLEVQISAPGRQFLVESLQLGGGGMSFSSPHPLSISEPVELAFSLPDGHRLQLAAVVWWAHGHNAGVRFDPNAPDRIHVERWIEQQRGATKMYAKPI